MSKQDTIKRMPLAYSSFAALFGQMDVPLLRVLGGLLTALSSQMQTAGAHQNRPDGDFIGYDGLENRGGLSQLLESEWLLRELDADDFVRRVAEGEVLFRKRNYENTGARNTLAVILDCGPWMLGRNRLIGLAALFYLAIRAERTKATLRWIIPQADKHEWIDGLNRSTIQRYLGQVVQGQLPVETIDTALAHLVPQGNLECWYVGSQQTADLARHPDIGSSFLLQNHHETDTALVDVTSRGRRLAQVDVTFEDDATCIAALRRPFKPEISKRAAAPRGSKASGTLSAIPFHTDWLLDRHNLAVLIRVEFGLLWQPLLPSRRSAGVWLPLRTGEILLGAQVDRDRTLTAMLAAPSEQPGKTGPQSCSVKLIKVNLEIEGTAPTLLATGQPTLDPAQFADLSLGNLHMQPHCSIVRADGVRQHFGIEHGALRGPDRKDARVVFQDATYRVQITSGDPGLLQVISVTRGAKMLEEPWPKAGKSLCELPRRVLFSPSSKVLALTKDERTFTIFGLGAPFDVEVPVDLALLHVESAHQAIAWNADNNHLVELNLDPATSWRRTTVQYQGATPDLPRYCPLTGTVFAFQSDDASGMGHFVPIQSKRGWKDVTPLDIGDAIERARTIWLEN